MIDAHEDEQARFDEEVDKLTIPKPKYSKEVLNLRHMLNNIIKAKKYDEAQDVSDKLDLMEKRETEKWNK